MAQQRESNEPEGKAEELRRTLAALHAWTIERQRALREIIAYIQDSLASGRLTEKKDLTFEKKYLSKRTIATLTLDASQLKRSLCFMKIRKRLLEKELQECENQAQNTSSSA
jgi:hypothetical protein